MRVPESEHEESEEEESEYVLIDLDDIADYDFIPTNAPFVLSGLDTINPILLIDNKIKLVGEYQETVGTCLVFSKADSAHVEEGPSGVGLGNQSTVEGTISPVASVNRVLKFKLFVEAGGREEQR